MVTITAFRKMALDLPGTEEAPHFDLASFRIGKKIFATIHQKENRVMVKLSPLSQSVYCSCDAAVFSPVPGGWGRQGATFVDLGKAGKVLLREALATAFREVQAKPLKKK
jgi:hypothetical protein